MNTHKKPEKTEVRWIKRFKNGVSNARLCTDENHEERKQIWIPNHASTAAEENARRLVSNSKVKSISSPDILRSFIVGEVQNLNNSTLSQLALFIQLNENIRRWRQDDSTSPATPLTNVGFSIPNDPYLGNDERFLQFDR